LNGEIQTGMVLDLNRTEKDILDSSQLIEAEREDFNFAHASSRD
jgi:hypothetical protein